MKVFLHLLHLFGFSPLCVIICLLKLPSTKKAYSQSKHFGILSIMCFQMKFQIGCRNESISAFVPFIWPLVRKTKKKGSKKSPSPISKRKRVSAPPLFQHLPCSQASPKSHQKEGSWPCGVTDQKNAELFMYEKINLFRLQSSVLQASSLAP